MGQVMLNVYRYLPEEIPTCPKQTGTISLEVVSLRKKSQSAVGLLIFGKKSTELKKFVYL